MWRIEMKYAFAGPHAAATNVTVVLLFLSAFCLQQLSVFIRRQKTPTQTFVHIFANY